MTAWDRTAFSAGDIHLVGIFDKDWVIMTDTQPFCRMQVKSVCPDDGACCPKSHSNKPLAVRELSDSATAAGSGIITFFNLQ